MGRDELRGIVAELAGGIGEWCGAERPLLVGLLRGSVIFLADLARALPIECEVDFLAISPFGRGRVRVAADLSVDIEGRTVVIVEDIVDTGLTLSYLLRTLETRAPASLAVVALLDRRVRRLVEVPVRWSGREIDDRYVIGYGLDFEGRYRNLPGIHVVTDLAQLAAEPDLLVSEVYGTP